MGSSSNIIVGNAAMIYGSTNLGYLVDGVTLVVESDTWYAKVENVQIEVEARRPKASYKLQTTLVEPTQANMKIAFDWQNTATGTDPIVLEFGGENMVPTEEDVTIYGYVPGGNLYTRSIIINRAIAEVGGEVKHTDEDMTKISVVFKGLWDETNSCVGSISDAAGV